MPTVPYRILSLDITPAATSSTVQTPTYSSYGSSDLTASSAVTSKNISDSLSTKATADYSTSSAQIAANDCSTATFNEELHQSYFGWQLAVPEGEAVLTAIVLSVIIVLTIIGNILVILSVFTYKPLRIVQNFFIVSLAVADLTVALLVLPFNVAYSILGHWEFGIHLCKMWLTCDVMCCTSSILNLCAIALDRYWAITDPINYAQKRTVGRVLLLITGVWILSLIISSPPLVGWNDWPEEFTSAAFCELTSNRGYVIYSSLGSFFIPLAIMTIVYIEIYIATRRRLRDRAQASKINATIVRTDEAEAIMAASVLSANENGREITSLYSSFLCCSKCVGRPTALMMQNDKDSVSSETHANEVTSHHLEHRVVVVAQRKKSRRAIIKDSIKRGKARSEWKPFSATTLTTEQHYEYWDEKTCAEREHRLLATNTNNKDSDNYEGPTEIGIVMEHHMETCPRAEALATDNNEVEHVSLKITPPQSSTGATSSQALPLHKNPSGMYHFIEEKQKISLSKERRAARTLGIIMGVFVICWLPFFLMYVILPFCNSCCPSSKFKNFITWLGYINSGLNPVIYTIFNLDFRKAFKRLLGMK